MRSLLVGNGVNIQFDKTGSSAQQIVLRILKNCDRFDFPAHIVVDQPYLLKDYLGDLFLKARDILAGRFDRFAVGTAEKESLAAFKEKYTSRLKHLRMTDICYEDYYLLHDLLCHYFRMGNPEMYYIRESMRMVYLYAIYNDGALDKLYLLYPNHYIDYLKSFDSVFSTNYDSNIENATGNNVIHLHGQFDRLSDVYNPESLRNKLPDAPIQSIEIDHRYDYLYSNAITTHSGAYKEFIIKQIPMANDAIDHMAKAYNENPSVRADVEGWIASDNPLIINLGYAIRLKAENPELSFSQQYDFDAFREISGELEILGISPWNDFHIFRTIDNSSIEKCVYYYNRQAGCEKVKELLPKLSSEGRLCFKSASEVWEADHG